MTEPNTELNQPPGGGSPDPAPVPPAPTVDPPTPHVAPPQAKKNVSTRDLAGIRKSSEGKGRKQALNEMTKKARSLGYSSVDEMFTAIAEGKKGNPAPQDQPPPTAQPDARKAVKLEKKNTEIAAANMRLRKRVASIEKQNRFLKKRVSQLEAEASLRVAAVRAGVTDVDYSLQLLRREMGGKRGKELEGFEPVKFFSGLKKSHPILFTPQEEPANTGNGSPQGAPPGPPKVGAPPPPNGGDPSGDEKNARDMTKEQFDKHLADLGIRNPGASRSF